SDSFVVGGERVFAGLLLGLALDELKAERLCDLTAGVRGVGGEHQGVELLTLPQIGGLLRDAGGLGLPVLVAILPVDLWLFRGLLGGAGCPFGAGNSRCLGPEVGASLLTHGECSLVRAGCSSRVRRVSRGRRAGVSAVVKSCRRGPARCP